MFKKVIYFITKQNRQISLKESFIKNKSKYNQHNKKVFDNIIIRKYHSSNTNYSGNNKPPNNFIAFIISSFILGIYFNNKKNL